MFLWNLVDLERIKWEGPDALSPGRHTIEFDFKYDGLGAGTLAFNNFSGLGRPGTGTLKVDGKEVDDQAMEKTLPMILQWDESFDIGSDTLTGVNDADYKPPFPLTAKLNKLTIKVDRPQLSPADIKKLRRRCRRRRSATDRSFGSIAFVHAAGDLDFPRRTMPLQVGLHCRGRAGLQLSCSTPPRRYGVGTQRL